MTAPVQSEKKPVRYVELVRVSSTGQSDRDTPEAQRAALDKMRVARPGVLVERIEDGACGLSGALGLADRPDLQRLKKLSADRAFDEIRVFSLDRLTRAEDPRDRFEVFGFAKDAKALMVDCQGAEIDPTTEIGEIQFFFQSKASADERKKILLRTQAGKKLMAAKGGKPGARTPYGFTYNKQTKTWGIHEERAEVVRKMYHWAVENLTLAQITERLNEEGHLSPSGRQWGKTGVNACLQHDRYTGNGCYRSGSETINVKLPAIVTPELAEAARAAISKRDHIPVRTKKGNPYRHRGLLRHRIVCQCGATMHIEPRHDGWVGYRCASGRGYGRSHYRVVRVAETDEAIWQAVGKALRDPNLIADALGKRKGKKSAAADWEQQIAQCKKKLASFKQREKAIYNVLGEGLSEEAGREQLQTIKRQREMVERTKTLAEKQLAALDANTDAIATLERERARLLTLLDSTDFETRERLIASVTPPDGPLVTVRADGLELHGIFKSDPNQGQLFTSSSLPEQLTLSLPLRVSLARNPRAQG